AIGACSIAPLEMCVGYATTADGGIFHAPTSILRVKDHNGTSLFDAGRPTGDQVVPKHVADEMNDMLHTVVTEGTGKDANIFPYVCGKTGTTQDDRDAWFIGFTPELTTAVWAGNDNYWSHMEGVHGGSVCAGGWNKFMVTAVPLMQQYHSGLNADDRAQAIAQKQNEQQATQENTRMVRVKLCTESLLLATANCPHTVFKSFPEGKQPTLNCSLDHSAEKTDVYICPVSGKLATSYCPNPILKSFTAESAPVTYCTVHKPTGA
nr:penicillin-binding transpeptidase domain-containing protein [Armatimonadota bacterium]